MNNSYNIKTGVNLDNSQTASIVNTKGDVAYNATTDKLEVYNGAADPIVAETKASQGANRLKNKDLEAASTAIVDATDTTKKLQFDVSGNTTGITTTISAQNTSAETLHLPAVSGGTDTIISRTSSDTGASRLQNKDVDASTFNIVDPLDTTKKVAFTASGNTTGVTTTIAAQSTAAETLNLPAVSGTDTLVSRTSTDTLTNKTLTTPTINGSGGTLTLPAGPDTLIARDTTDTLTNKAISGSSNTLTNIATSSLSGTVAIANGGTGQTTQQAALNALTGTQSSGKYLRSDGVNSTLSSIQAADVPTLNQNTTGTASNVTGIVAKANGGTGIDNSSVTFPSSGTIVTETATETLTNKTFGDSLTLAQIVTPANPSSGFNKVYPKSDGHLYLLNSAGVEQQVGTGSSSSSGGSKNYLTNGNFETGLTTGWSLGNVALTSNFPSGTPTFGSGASINLSMSVVSSGVLAGSFSLSYASSAATTAGNFLASDAFTLDKEDQAKILTFKFYYSAVTNPSNCNFSGTSSNSFGVAIYDVTNSAWIQPAGVYNIVQSSGVGYSTGTFQTTSNSTSYRLVVYNANATAGAATLYFDDFTLGPQTAPMAPAVGDWNAYSPTVSTGTWTNLNGWWRRVGDSMEVVIKTGPITANGSGNYYWSLPSGYSIDLSGLKGSSTTPSIASGDGGLFTLGDPIGIATIRQESSAGYSDGTSGSTWPDPRVYVASSTTVAVIAGSATQQTRGFAAGSAMSLTSNIGNNCYIGMRFIVPISGWSSNCVMSNDTDTRVVAASYYGSTSQSVATGVQINFDTKLFDTHSAVTTGAGAWKFTAPVSGIYEVQCSLNSTTAQGANIGIVYKNGTNYAYVVSSNVTNQSQAGSVLLQLNAGDYVDVRTGGGGPFTINGGSAPYYTYIDIKRLSGPAVVAATESVNNRYIATSGSVPGGVETAVNFPIKDFDSHNAVTTGPWKFTAPVSGKYQVDVQLTYASPTISASEGYVYIRKNGTAVYAFSSWWNSGTSFTAKFGSHGSDIVSLLAGDYLEVIAFQNNGSALNINTTNGYSYVSVTRVGN